MDEQASTGLAPTGLEELASMIEEDPETDSTIENDGENADTEPDEDTSDEADDEPDEGEPEPTPVETKITVKVKGADGADETLELTTDEIANSYMRQSDYTRKMQSLSEREGQAVTFLKEKHDQIRNHYTEQAEFYKHAVTQMAGIRSESEMQQLAQSDPAGWVAENQRQQSVRNFLNTLDQSIQGEKQRAQAETEQMKQQRIQQMTERAWSELSKEKIDKPILTKIYADVTKNYGYTPEELGSVYDPRLVKMMRDATAYQNLKAKAPEVTRKANDAPRMPTAKQATPADERKRRELNERFKGGRGKLADLAALLR